jgi:hypothetical protein
MAEIELDQLEDEEIEEEAPKPLDGAGYSKGDLRALRAAVTWLRDDVELYDDLDYSSFFKGVLIARGVRAELAQDAWLLSMLEQDEYDEVLRFVEELDQSLDTNRNGVNISEVMGKRWVLPLHLDPEWRLTEQATNNWLGTIEDIDGETVAEMSALAVVDFQEAYVMASDLVMKHNELVDPRQEVFVNRAARNKVIEHVSTTVTNVWDFYFTDGTKLTVEAVSTTPGAATLNATT